MNSMKNSESADADEARLVAGQFAVPQVAVDFGRRQQIGEQRHRPEEGEGQRQRHHHQPVQGVGLGDAAVGIAFRQGVPVPDALLADGAAQHAVDGFHHRKMRAQPAAVEAAVFPRDPDAGADHAEDRQAAAQDDIERGLGGVDASGEEVVQPQCPVHAEEKEMLEVEVEAEQVEYRRQHEQDEESGLEPAVVFAECYLTGPSYQRINIFLAPPSPWPGRARRAAPGWSGRW